MEEGIIFGISWGNKGRKQKMIVLQFLFCLFIVSLRYSGICDSTFMKLKETWFFVSLEFVILYEGKRC